MHHTVCMLCLAPNYYMVTLVEPALLQTIAMFCMLMKGGKHAYNSLTLPLSNSANEPQNSVSFCEAPHKRKLPQKNEYAHDLYYYILLDFVT